MKAWISTVSLTIFCLCCVLSLSGCGNAQDSEAGLPDESAQLGLQLSVENISSEGCTLVCLQEGGDLEGDWATGSSFILERREDDRWLMVEPVLEEGSYGWDDAAYLIQMGGRTTLPVEWAWLYGELPSGHYRLSKEFFDINSPDGYVPHLCRVEFDLSA